MENKFKGQALNIRVVVKDIQLDNKNSFGFDTSSAVEKNGYQKAGIVVSVGEQTPKIKSSSKYNNKFIIFILNLFKKDEYTLKIGDTILYDKTRMTSLTLEGESYAMLNYIDIFAKI